MDRSEWVVATQNVNARRVAVRSIAWLGVVRSISDVLTKLGHAEGRRTLMQHSMTVWADWNKICERIGSVSAADLGQRSGVVHVDESSA